MEIFKEFAERMSAATEQMVEQAADSLLSSKRYLEYGSSIGLYYAPMQGYVCHYDQWRGDASKVDRPELYGGAEYIIKPYDYSDQTASGQSRDHLSNTANRIEPGLDGGTGRQPYLKPVPVQRDLSEQKHIHYGDFVWLWNVVANELMGESFSTWVWGNHPATKIQLLHPTEADNREPIPLVEQIPLWRDEPVFVAPVRVLYRVGTDAPNLQTRNTLININSVKSNAYTHAGSECRWELHSLQEGSEIPKQDIPSVAADLQETFSDGNVPTGINWMQYHDQSLKLSQLVMPGTHDSAAFKMGNASGAAAFARAHTLTQDRSIRGQLDMGIRFLDIRLRAQDGNDTLALHHGKVFLAQMFGEVLNDCFGFLRDNPSESLIMSIKDEGSAKGIDFRRSLQGYIDKYPGDWILDGRIPTLAEARGKILVINRFDSNVPAMGLACNWPDNDTLYDAAKQLCVQDEYRLTLTKFGGVSADWGKVETEKTKDMTRFVETVAAGYNTGSTVNLNFASAALTHPGGLPSGTPREFSARMNDNVARLARDQKTTGMVYIMDFPEPQTAQDIYLAGLRGQDRLKDYECVISNSFYGKEEYLYAADYNPSGDCRKIHTWVPGERVFQGSWFLEKVKGKPGVFKLFNTHNNEYLFASDEMYSVGDDSRRYVYCWRPGLNKERSEWKISQLDTGRFSIRNVATGEYLYASKYFANSGKDKDRRLIFTWTSQEQVVQGVWNIQMMDGRGPDLS